MSTQPDEQDDRELTVEEWAEFFDQLSRRAEEVAIETTIELLGGEVPGAASWCTRRTASPSRWRSSPRMRRRRSCACTRKTDASRASS